MGLDGFSMSNLGMHRNFTSAQMANEADALARQTLENQIADVDGVGKKEKAGAKDKDAAFNGAIPFIPPEEENEQEENQDEETNQEESIEQIDESNEDDEEPKYRFKMNNENMIEVWDNDTNQIIRKITPEEARKVFGKFDKVPGVLVNRTV